MILNILRSTSGKKDKAKAVEWASKWDKDMFKYAYNPDLVYNLKFGGINYQSLKEFCIEDLELLKKILTKTIAGNAARNAVMEHCKVHGDLVKLICNKDLDCGVTATTLNKVFGKGFVPAFDVQLAIEVPIEKLTLPLLGQLKYNGVRVLAFCTKGGVVFRTRNGKFFKFPKLAEKLMHGYKCYPRECVLDGELCFGDSKGRNHTEISGIVNSAIHGNDIKDFKNELVFNVFDILDIKDFEDQVCNQAYDVRWEKLNAYIRELASEVALENRIKIAETYVFHTYEDINNKYNELYLQGYEGLILKNSRHLYKYKRSAEWVKIKAVKTADLSVVAVNPGKDKYEGMIGSLSCTGNVEGKLVHVDVGTGLSDADRLLSEDHYLHECVELKYNEVIWNKEKGGYSLFLPRFVTIRGDK